MQNSNLNRRQFIRLNATALADAAITPAMITGEKQRTYNDADLVYFFLSRDSGMPPETVKLPE